MKLRIQTKSGRWLESISATTSIAISQTFDDHQPSHFDAPFARTATVSIGEFVGDTHLGGSCNVKQHRIIPHCNGTHTECVGHVVVEHTTMNNLSIKPQLIAQLVSIEAKPADHIDETDFPKPKLSDHVITAQALNDAVPSWDDDIEALIIRTQPNDTEKRSRQYKNSEEVPYLTQQAAQWIVERNIEHLVVDMPSVDRLYDEGLLSAHRIFWGLPQGSRSLEESTRPQATITEMAFIPNDNKDGIYLLSINALPWESDAVPCAPQITELTYV